MAVHLPAVEDVLVVTVDAARLGNKSFAERGCDKGKQQEQYNKEFHRWLLRWLNMSECCRNLFMRPVIGTVIGSTRIPGLLRFVIMDLSSRRRPSQLPISTFSRSRDYYMRFLVTIPTYSELGLRALEHKLEDEAGL